MDDDLPIVGPAVDLAQAPPINYKRTLAFLNHFVTHTVRFLNRFSGVCEQKLSDLQVKIQRLEITLSILEAKLSSIPGLDQISAPESTTTVSSAPVTNEESVPNKNLQSEVKSPVQNDDNVPIEAAVEPEVRKMTVSQDPRYAKYFKMLAFGVPLSAVKGKMAAEGFNADLLDTPDAPSDGGDAVALSDGDDSDDDNDRDSSSEASSFSDDD
ncbi:WASH complex subunit 3-like isoform X1 [Hydractinia symbiolongicarpus]|uniref:WASH complex subunit 3-like isoform X1 n=1 Tax=Hydractinia symbiolongicarpus TaxID=13093 RepID=UPI00254F38AC|nr:WASH complex subunit 3-like isoform X1 [Hydractinia symbiolongicarpus]